MSLRILLLLFFLNCSWIHSDACSTYGSSNVNSGSKKSYSGDPGVIITDYVIQCACGRIDKWTYRSESTSTIWFQAWRPDGSGTNYRLVAETKVVDSSGSTDVSSSQMIVRANDVLGFYQESGAMGYASSSVDYKTTAVDTRSYSGTLDWGSESSGNFKFRFNADVSSATDSTPAITNLDHSLTIDDTESVGTTVYTVTVTNVYITDLTMATPSSYFDLDSGNVKVKSALTPDTYELGFIGVSYCATLTSSGTLTITVRDTTLSSELEESEEDSQEAGLLDASSSESEDSEENSQKSATTTTTPTTTTTTPTTTTTTPTTTTTTPTTTTTTPTTTTTTPTTTTTTPTTTTTTPTTTTTTPTTTTTTPTTTTTTPTTTTTTPTTTTTTPTTTTTTPTTTTTTPTTTTTTPTTTTTTPTTTTTTPTTTTTTPTTTTTTPTTTTTTPTTTTTTPTTTTTTPTTTKTVPTTTTTSPTTTTTTPTTTTTTPTTTTAACITTPNITNLDKTISTMDYVNIGTVIYKLKVTGGYSSNVTMDTSPYFEYVPSFVKIKAAMPSGTYILSFNMTGTCGSISDKRLTVTVNNTAPFIKNLPASAAVKESETSERLLLTLSTKDTSVFDNVTCNISATAPATPDFEVKIVTGTSYGIYLKSNPSLNYRTNTRYTLTVRCTDTKDFREKLFYVDILNNQQPFFINLPARVELPRLSSPIGTSVLNVSAGDPENDSLSYNMSCSRTSTCPFAISNTGEIKTSADIKTVTNPAYSLYVYITDGWTLIGPNTVTVIITDFSGNNAPHISNLPMMLYVSENVALGSSLYHVTATDKDDSQTVTFSASHSHVMGNSLFEFNESSGLLRSSTTTNIDYEALVLSGTTFVICVTASDGIVNVTETLTVIIRNVNEAPYFHSSLYSVTGNEGPEGTKIGNPGFNVTDPDLGATLKYSMDCPQFRIDASTGDVILRTTYDVDDTSVASTLTCNVKASDGQLTGTTTLKITVNNINDNAPTFAYRTFFVNTSTTAAVGTVLGSVAATDADIGVYGDVTYTLNQTSLNQSYLGVTSSGDLYIVAGMSDLSQGQIIQLSVSVQDTGGLNDTADILLILPKISTASNSLVTTSTTQERYRTFFEDTRNCAWFTSAAVMATVTIGVMFYTMYKKSVLQRMKNTFRSLNRQPSKKLKKNPKKPSAQRESKTVDDKQAQSQTRKEPIDKPKPSRPPPRPKPKVRASVHNVDDGKFFKRMGYY